MRRLLKHWPGLTRKKKATLLKNKRCEDAGSVAILAKRLVETDLLNLHKRCTRAGEPPMFQAPLEKVESSATAYRATTMIESWRPDSQKVAQRLLGQRLRVLQFDRSQPYQ